MRPLLRLLPLVLVAACASARPGTSPPAAEAPSAPAERVVHVTASRFEFDPDVITLKVNVPVVIELTSADRRHGFAAPDFHVDEEIAPGTPTLVRLTPDRTGTFAFHCSVFCGEGHEGMTGTIVVEP